MKKSNLIWGSILIILGVIFGLNALNITHISIFFKGWWTLFIIIPSLIGLLDDKDKKGSLIGLVIGIIFLLAARDIIDFTVIGHLIVPALLVIIGLFLIFKKEDKDFVISKEYEKDKEIEVTFSDQTITVDEEFSSRKASAVFGKLTLDLTKAKIKKDTNIKLEAVFGSVNLILPEGLDVKIKSTPIFGGISNNYNNTGSKTIYIEADAVFGGVTIK